MPWRVYADDDSPRYNRGGKMKTIEVNGKAMVGSLDLLGEINFVREKEGNSERLRNGDLVEAVRDEFKEEIANGNFFPIFYKESTDESLQLITLTPEQAIKILERECKVPDTKRNIKKELELEAKELSTKIDKLEIFLQKEFNEETNILDKQMFAVMNVQVNGMLLYLNALESRMILLDKK